MVLNGVKVLDLTRVVAGPACTRTLADYGAEVWKIEPPDGDLMRRGVPKANGVALTFAQQNAGKRHLCVDLRNQGGQDLVMGLATKADVVVENYRPGVATRLGLSYEDIKAVNPGVVYCSISGYGQTGSASNRRAYAPVIHAELGLLHLNARERGTEPLPESVSHADFAVGAQAASAILGALFNKERTGAGCQIDVSMAETMLATNEYAAVEINGGFGDEISPFRPGKAAVVQLRDGTYVQIPGNPTTWIFGMAKALNKEADMAERGWFSPKETQLQEGAVKELMQMWAQEYDHVAEFESALDAARVPLGTVKAVADVPQEAWAQERQVFVEIDVNGERRLIPRSPVRFNNELAGPSEKLGAGSALRGAHNRETIERVLDLSPAELDRLEKEGILQAEKD
ncbi:MAG: hypothetical protein GKR90_06390 [Pseudomonadales bacterium]|nr:hypothetical protein [Pseudomonadales bacterium]